MLVVLEAARLLVDRTSSEWQLSPEGAGTRHGEDRSSRLGATIGGWVSRAASAIRRAYERRQVIKELSAKDDRLLADIGITRDQIAEVAEAGLTRGPDHASRLVTRTPQVRYEAVAVERVANDNETRIAA